MACYNQILCGGVLCCNDVRLSRGRGERGLSGRGTSAFTRLDVVAKLRLHLQERLVVALVLVAAQPFLRV